jgi:hypothetical protein
MKRFARHLFTFCSVVSLLLLVLVCVLCIETYNTAGSFIFRARGQLWRVECFHARVELNDGPQQKLCQKARADARNDFETKRRDETDLIRQLTNAPRKWTRSSTAAATTREYARLSRLTAAWREAKVATAAAAQKLAAVPNVPAFSARFPWRFPSSRSRSSRVSRSVASSRDPAADG